MIRRTVGSVAVAALLMVAEAAAPATAPAAVTLAPIGSFAQPVDVAAPPADTTRVFVVQKGGKVMVVRGGVAATFMDITSKVRSTGNEQGLLSIAFAPDYAASGTFYLYYTAPSPSGSGRR